MSEKKLLKHKSITSRISQLEDEADDHGFDDILQEKIKCGKFQIISSIALGMLWLSDGAEMQVLGFILPLIENEFDVEPWQSTLIGSIVFLTWGTAAIWSGKLADHYGRKKPMLVSVLGQAIFAFLSAFSQTYTQLLLSRALFGFFLGIGNPLTASYISEIVPRNLRGVYFAVIYNMFPLGEILTIIVAYFCLNNLQFGNWRLLLIWTSIPGFVAFYLTIKYLKESPRYLLVLQPHKHSKEESIELINEIGIWNNGDQFEKLNENQIEKLFQWGDKLHMMQNQYKGSIKQLFSKDYKSLTIKTMMMWFSLAFVYYGLVFQLPTILSKIHQDNNVSIKESNNSDFIGILLSAFVEVPSNLLGLYLLEKQEFGRKFALQWSYLICSVSCLICYFHPYDDNVFFFFVSVIKFFINIAFLACFTFTSEIYPTSIRSTGIGFNNSVTRFGGVTMPWVSLMFYSFGNTGPLLSCGIVALFSATAAFTLKQDTKNIKLDTYIELKNVDKKVSRQYSNGPASEKPLLSI